MFEYNLIRIPPSLQNRVGYLFAGPAELVEACLSVGEVVIDNQQ